MKGVEHKKYMKINNPRSYEINTVKSKGDRSRKTIPLVFGRCKGESFREEETQNYGKYEQ